MLQLLRRKVAPAAQNLTLLKGKALVLAIIQDRELFLECRRRNEEWRPDFSGMTFKRLDLHGLWLMCANFSRAVCRGANLENADFRWANLEGVNFQGANLHGANFYGAILTNASLREADLSGANLCCCRADLTTVDLSGANLEGVRVTKNQMAILPPSSGAEEIWDPFDR